LYVYKKTEHQVAGSRYADNGWRSNVGQNWVLQRSIDHW